jgi:hypothetical protein
LSFLSRFSTQFVYIILSLRLKVIGFFSASLPFPSERTDMHRSLNCLLFRELTVLDYAQYP